jgi:hypothetical protein
LALHYHGALVVLDAVSIMPLASLQVPAARCAAWRARGPPCCRA